MKKHGLGRGLGSLIPENSTEVSNSEGLISIQLIKPNKDQPRKNFDDEKVDQLSKSIKEHGIIQPLITYKDGENYIIIAGERRWRAAKKCMLKEVPVVVVDKKSDKQVLELSLIENIQREDLNSIEVALGYKSLIEDFSLTHDELSERIGRSRTSITNTLRLLQLDSRVQEYLIDKVITEGHGRALLSLDDKEFQYKLSQKIIDDGLSVRDIERIVKTLVKKDKKKDKEDYSIFLKAYSTQLEEKLGTKVVFKGKSKNKGKIEIEYYSLDDLERLMKIMS